MTPGWAEVMLGEVCDVVGGGTPKTNVSAFWNGDIPWVTPKDLSDQQQRYISRTARAITQAGLAGSSAQLLPPGSVLLSSRAPIGLVAINTVPMATNQGFKSLVPSPRIDAGYLAHWLAARTELLQSLGTGATFKEISKTIVSKIAVPLPPLSEQRRIARVLDAVESLRARRLESFARFDALTLSHFVEVIGDPERNPRGWALAPVSAFADFEGGRSFAGNDESDAEAEFRVLRVSAVTSGEFRPLASRPVPRDYMPPEQHLVRAGDLLFSRANTSELVGAVALVDRTVEGLLLPDKLWRFVWRGDAVRPEYVWQLFRTRTVRSAISRRSTGTSGSMKNISAAKLKGIEVMVPPIRVQDDFVRAFRLTRSLHERARQHLGRLDALLASLQHRAFTGAL